MINLNTTLRFDAGPETQAWRGIRGATTDGRDGLRLRNMCKRFGLRLGFAPVRALVLLYCSAPCVVVVIAYVKMQENMVAAAPWAAQDCFADHCEEWLVFV